MNKIPILILLLSLSALAATGSSKDAAGIDLFNKEKAGEVIAGGKETNPPSITQTISSAIKKSSIAVKQEPASIEKSPVSKEKIPYSIKSAEPVKIRSQAATGDFEWNPQNFAGFYYDLDSDVGTEVLTATLKDGKLSGSYPYGLTYQTTAQKNDFAFEDWGSYNVIGFMGEKCFAGYLDTAGSTDDWLFEASGSKNVLSKNRLIKILIDDDTEKTITTDTPLTLQDGYVLSIDSIDIDGNLVTLTLSKDGSKLITKKISPSIDGATMADKTFVYRKNFGNLRDVIIIAVHFKNAFQGADLGLATINAVWQLSDESMDVSKGAEYGKMTIKSVTSDSITMNNADNDLTLSRNKDTTLMPGIGIKTADTDRLRYCIYRDITNPGTYELRGAVATDSFAWTADNFAGFYYDIDDNLKTESLRTIVTDGELAQPDGITYTTMAKTTNFAFKDWGSYAVIGFLGEKCFAEYVEGFLFDKSTDQSALAKKLLLKILTNDDTEKTMTTGAPLMLEEGYALAIKSISPDGNDIYLELSKDGKIVHSAILHPSMEAASMADKTYLYKVNVGDLKNVVLIAVHFKNAFRGADQNLATVDAVWQLSASPISVTDGISFGKLSISEISGDRISMNNKGNPIKLSKHKYVSLAGDINLQTADADALRYYIVQKIVSEV
jgi:S-layer protein (TIGR01567 family)